jgi:hypothetical protein
MATQISSGRSVPVITAQCLRVCIFEAALVEHPDPHADLIRAYQDGTLGRRTPRTRVETTGG